nr:MAG TPA: hypothetical protein [Bacteriophage sp.]
MINTKLLKLFIRNNAVFTIIATSNIIFLLKLKISIK